MSPFDFKKCFVWKMDFVKGSFVNFISFGLTFCNNFLLLLCKNLFYEAELVCF